MTKKSRDRRVARRKYNSNTLILPMLGGTLISTSWAGGNKEYERKSNLRPLISMDYIEMREREQETRR